MTNIEGRISFPAPPNFRENEVQFFCFHPELSRLWLQFRYGTNGHPKEVFRLSRFFSARADIFQEFLFRHCVIRFNIVCANAGPGADQLSNDPIRHGALRNGLGKIDDRFTEARRSLFKIINVFFFRLFADGQHVTVIPKQRFAVTGVLGSRHSFVIRHSPFVIRHSCFVIRLMVRKKRGR